MHSEMKTYGEMEAQILSVVINPLNAKLNPTYHLLALLGAHHILHISRIRVNLAQGLYRHHEH